MLVIPIDLLLVPGANTQLVKASAFICFLSSLRQARQQETHEVQAVVTAHVVGADGLELIKLKYCIEHVEFDPKRLQFGDRS